MIQPAILVLAVLALVSPAGADDKFVHAEYGVQLNPPSKWKAIPAPKAADERYGVTSTLEILVRYQAPNPDSNNNSIVLDVIGIKDVDTLEAAVKSYMGSLEAKCHPTLEKQEPVKLAGRVGSYLLVDRGQGFAENTFVVAGEHHAIALVFTAGKTYAHKKADAFKEMAKGLTMLSAQQTARLATAPRASIATLPTGWHSCQTPNYDIQYNTEEAFARQVGTNLEAILKEYQARFPMQASMDEKTGVAPVRRFTVKCFKSPEEFNSYAASNGVQGAAAYFSPMQNELVCYKTVDEGRKKTFHILYHEASHQYMFLYMGERAEIPTWLNEGVAEYFYGGEFSGPQKFAIGINQERVGVIKEAVRRSTTVPLKKIFQYTQAEYYADAQLCYAEGWSLAYFLWLTKDATYKGRIDTFYAVLKDTKSKDQAFEKAFGDLDLDKMEADWKEFILHL